MKQNYILSAQAMVMVQGSSKGTQPKYFDGGYWYKVNRLGYEGLAETLVTKVLECSSIKDYVIYEACTINGKTGCRSQSFLKENESFLSFQRIYEIYNGGNLTDRIRRISSVSERIRFVCDFIREYTGADCGNYLSQILTLDMLTLNTDRHFNNLGIVMDAKKNSCRPAPVFDNGNSLLSDWDRFDAETIEGNLDRVVGQPFAANLEVQAQAAGFGLKVDYKKLEERIAREPESRGLMVLRHQLKRYKTIIPEI